MGGESPITETIGLGGFAQACALPLQDYQGGSAEVMIERNREMYEITYGENSDLPHPAVRFPRHADRYRRPQGPATPAILPVMDVGLAGRDGGQIGAGVIRAPRECFEDALAEYQRRFGRT